MNAYETSVLKGVPSLSSPSAIRSTEKAAMSALRSGAVRSASAILAHMTDALDRSQLALAKIDEESEPVRYARVAKRMVMLASSVDRLRSAGVCISPSASLRTQVADGVRMARIAPAARLAVMIEDSMGLWVADAPPMADVSDADILARSSAIVGGVRDALAGESIALVTESALV